MDFSFSGDTGNGFQFANQNECASNGFENGMKFTTNGIDNDIRSDLNCASAFGGGWWHSDCGYVCLTCSEAYFWWMSTKPECVTYSLTETRMLMILQ